MLHHLKAALPDARNTVLFAGYQAGGHARPAARGRRSRACKIHGETIPVHARIEQLDSMSAHADSTEILRWLGGFTRAAADDVHRARGSHGIDSSLTLQCGAGGAYPRRRPPPSQDGR